MSKEKSASQIIKKRARRKPGAFLGRLVKWSLFMAIMLMLMGGNSPGGDLFLPE